LICKKTGRVLLFHRSEDVYEPETWGIISGKIDEDENPKDAILRELIEETKLSEEDANRIILKPSYVYKKGSFTFYNYLGFVENEFTPTLNWENTDYKWCDIGDYPQPLHFGVSLLLKNIDLKKELYKKTIKKKLLAPNGKPSNLTPEQYQLVRTPAFKAWFGDWENSPETASKVVDEETKEPKVMYHGSKNDFTIFNPKAEAINRRQNFEGFYFTGDKNRAESYSNVKLFEVFINIRNPLNRHLGEHLPSYKSLNYIREKYKGDFNKEYLEQKMFQLQRTGRNSFIDGEDMTKILIMDNYDGVFDGSFDYGDTVAFKSNQIKLADGTNTTFDGNNPDVRYKDGGTTKTYRNKFNIKHGFNKIIHLGNLRSVSSVEGKESLAYKLWIKRKKDIKEGKFENGGYLIPDLLSSQEVEYKLGRELHWWNDDIVYLSGIEYKKVYLRPEYKRIF
jgi:8-oxo-dGTP pyrophosphatase MutT (NUDIX family)